MCDGRSWPSWTISSARSVSQTSIPAWRSASLSSISCVAIDLTLTTSVAPCVADDRATIAFASAASRAQWTVATGRGHARLELLEQRRQVAQDLVLDRRAGQAERLPVVALGDDAGALRPDRGRRPGEVGAELRVRERQPGRLGERRRAGEGRLVFGSWPGASGAAVAPAARSAVTDARGRQDLGEVQTRPANRAATAARRCASGTRSPAVSDSLGREGGPRPCPGPSPPRRRRSSRRTSRRTRSTPPMRGSSTSVSPSTAARRRGRPVADAQQPGRVAGRWKATRVREARADIGHPERRRRGTRSTRRPAAQRATRRAGTASNAPRRGWRQRVMVTDHRRRTTPMA